MVVGLTGGIGAGKTTFAALLAERGAQVIDADALGRDALKPGRPAWHSVVDQFGDEILVASSMEVDRKRLADIVFNNRDKLAALNAIVHPVIFSGVADHLERLGHTDEVVVLDAALVIEAGFVDTVDVLVVVTSERSKRRDRMSRERGMSVSDFNARVASQSPQQELVARADIVVENDGSLEDLAREADRVWSKLRELT
ncbi:MAG: dephospho-CoA kinase [Actinomycetota bacterium]